MSKVEKYTFYGCMITLIGVFTPWRGFGLSGQFALHGIETPYGWPILIATLLIAILTVIPKPEIYAARILTIQKGLFLFSAGLTVFAVILTLLDFFGSAGGSPHLGLAFLIGGQIHVWQRLRAIPK